MRRSTDGQSPTSGALVSQTLWSGASQMLPAIVGVLLTPTFVDRLGLNAYGIWALLLALLSVLTTLDGGIGQALVRYFGIYRAAPDRRAVSEFGRAAVALSIFAGALASVATLSSARWAVNLLDAPGSLAGEATDALALVGPLLGLALLSNIPTALLQANGRFRTLSVINTCSTAVYAVVALCLLAGTPTPRSLALALAARLTTAVVLGAITTRMYVAGGRVFPSLQSMREFARYASSLQTSALLGLVNSQIDVFIVAAVLPVRYVGLYAIGFQAAWTARGVALWAMPPIAAQLVGAFGEGGKARAQLLFVELDRWWQETVTVIGVVAAAAIWFLVPVWVGRPVEAAAWVAVGLSVGYAVNISSAVATSYVRAIGRPGVETRYVGIAVALNVLFTAPAALLWGVYGVVAGTVVGTIIGTLALPYIGAQAGLPELFRMFHDLPLPRLVTAAATTLVGDLMVMAVAGPHRLLRALLFAVPPLVALGLLVVRPAGGIRAFARTSPSAAHSTLPKGT